MNLLHCSEMHKVMLDFLRPKGGTLEVFIQVTHSLLCVFMFCPLKDILNVSAVI